LEKQNWICRGFWTKKKREGASWGAKGGGPRAGGNRLLEQTRESPKKGRGGLSEQSTQGKSGEGGRKTETEPGGPFPEWRVFLKDDAQTS